MPTLTAKERGILVLESWKEGRQEDPAWRRTMPNEQATEFNRYIDLMNVANVKFAAFIAVLEQLVGKLELRMCWLTTLWLWGEQVEEIGRAVRVAVREPIAASEYEALVEKGRNEYVPVEELAGLLAGEREDWQPEEIAPGLDGEPEVTDEAWEKAVSREEATLRRDVAAGELQAKGRGRRLAIRSGSFNQRYGRPDAAIPEAVLGFHVQPDEEKERVDIERRLLERLFLELDWPVAGTDRQHLTQSVASSTALGHRECVMQCQAIDQVVGEIAGHFDGVDPLKPDAREKLNGCVVRLEALVEQLAVLGVEVGTPEADDELLELLRSVVLRAAP